MNKMKLNSQEWEAHTRTSPASHVRGTVGVPTEFRYLELTLTQAERPQVMAGKLQHTFMLLARVKGLTQANLFNEDNR